jgi:TonB family protein
MFLEFYKLREQPFSETPDPRYVYLGRAHREALASLFYGIETGRGFLALIAEPGMGKTTLVFHLLERLRGSTRTAFLFQTQCDSRELLRYLLADLEIDTQEKDLAWMHERLKEVLISEARAGRHFVVFIDEAQNLSDSALETVRLLSNFETPRSKLIQIVLAGQPQLADKLARPELRQLCQRISIVSRLGPLIGAETSVYIDHRLQTAGYKHGHLFTPEARVMIAAWSQGVPRKINNLCFNALTLGYALGRKEIDCPLVQEAANDLEMKPFVSEQRDAPDLAKLTALQGSMKGPVNVLDQAAANSLQGAPKPKSRATRETAVATAEKPARPQPVTSTPASISTCRPASTPASIQAAFATCSEAPAVVAPPDAFWSSGRPTEPIVPAAEATPKSTVPPMGSRLQQASRRIILVAAAVVVFLAVGAAGFVSLHRTGAQPPAITWTDPVRVPSSVSIAASTVQRVRSKTNHNAIAFASQPTSQAPLARKPAWPYKILIIAPPAATRRSTGTIGRDEPPDLSGVASNASADTIQRVLPPSSNILPAPPLTSEQTEPVHVGGRVEEPQLVSKVLPNYPLAAKQIGLEGKVVIDAVIDTNGNVTKMKVVSGPGLLQGVALDSVRKWKYKPSYLDNKFVPVEMLITVGFRLR